MRYLPDHGLPLVQLKEQRRDLVVALQKRNGPVSSWELMQIAASTSHVVAIDLPGVGRSRGGPLSGSKREIAAVVHGLIAAIGRTLPKCIVVSADGDYGAVPGLKIENWRTTSGSPES